MFLMAFVLPLHMTGSVLGWASTIMSRSGNFIDMFYWKGPRFCVQTKFMESSRGDIWSEGKSGHELSPKFLRLLSEIWRFQALKQLQQ